MEEIEETYLDYMTKNRKLKLEEYDDDGNLVDVKEFSNDLLYNFCCDVSNRYLSTLVSRKSDLEQFNEKELNLINKIMGTGKYSYLFSNKDICLCWFTDIEVKWFKNLFKENTLEEINFALILCDYREERLSVSTKSPYFNKKFNFTEALQFVKERTGIYYTVNNEGKSVHDFVEKPTKKQLRYQRNKHGHRCVFLNFKDWKEYSVSENELTE